MRLRIAISGVLLAIAFATGTEARAAFIALDLGACRHDESNDGTTAGTNSAGMQDQSQVFETPDRPGVPGSRFYTRTGRGMTSNTTSVPVGSGAAGVAVTASEAHLTGGQLVMKSEREGRCDLPPPHLAGVFRPPRCR